MPKVNREVFVIYIVCIIGVIVFSFQIMTWGQFNRLQNKTYNKARVIWHDIVNEEKASDVMIIEKPIQGEKVTW